MVSDKIDLTHLSLEINRALVNRDVKNLIGHLADYMHCTGMKAERAELRKIPIKDKNYSETIRLVKSDD